MCFGIRCDNPRCTLNDPQCTYFVFPDKPKTAFETGKEYVIFEQCDHEDKKTLPENYPPLKKNDKVTLVGRVNNFYGVFARVRTQSGKVYDIRAAHMKLKATNGKLRR